MTKTGLNTLSSILSDVQDQLNNYAKDISKKVSNRTQILKMLDKTIGDLFKSRVDVRKLEKLITKF